MRRHMCSRCGSAQADVYVPYARQWMCGECFTKFYEARVRKTVEKYGMLRGRRRVAVAVSGGKDSASLLYCLKKLYPDVDIVAVHFYGGIGEYSEDCLRAARELCESLGVELQVYRLPERDGFSVPDFEGTKYGKRVCATCSMIRRWALNRMAREVGADVLATGHNLDDTVEVMFSLFVAGDFEELRRLKPVLPPEHPSQVWKVKPLVNTPERDNREYARVNKLPVRSVECPYAREARSTRMKRMLDEWERRNRNLKFQLYSVFAKKLIPILDNALPEQPYTTCRICGGASIGDVCAVCRRRQYILEVKGAARAES